ncbi:bifunctional 23S rRNA (guanine(2069)-N(7))-methyltransferase RlmK/23S rRNA (guanine(2445)-N(2))-methyltransferase RlmL [Permianibacter sp. IMCC34836]|uniref:bifunctional 23S rRNA (guanine(2069)-N(7))-methyltransferase RlmK/23S rRNA (guanine(2445)-N(2))-methyltransferase RlmL n=1 Tax=Permianibacter fluminis TaxID=2738515 RepID=UPI0015517B9D|nr:bifunctional 23S rRNA (guanine(2069)-N(7))-methyltransferase RlmK/23S rRNA (guanine(2445)-N(2))-methyltransferase RlmL [Permianibacter fluminis]NQD38783.1 bifunctional 23S rRNA (guanine(2069)-N(7))-methyltransferase RlmK/23S rRNA (guanine(2445)-N(2))-methyltransferase RlmL [Permianibacter fluminis]
MTHKFFAPCAKGLEYLLVDELKALGAENVHEALAGVHFDGSLETGYRAVLWSRLASRVLLLVKTAIVDSTEAMYEAVRAVDWLAHMTSEDTLAVDFVGQNEFINHTQFGAQKVKDGVVDQFRARGKARPSVDTSDPVLRINAHLQRDEFTLCIDLSGHPLHERGYREKAGVAPIKENLAAAMLIRARWPAIAEAGGDLVDPFCGSGTLPIEAVLMAAHIAPGLIRSDFGMNQGWLGHDDALWQRLRKDAGVQADDGIEALRSRVFGFDADGKVLQVAQENAEQAKVEDLIQFERVPLERIRKPARLEGAGPGLVIGNPPYGERLGDVESLKYVYHTLGERLLSEFDGWQAAIITSEPLLARSIGVRSHKQYALYNGALPCKLYLFDVNAAAKRHVKELETPAAAIPASASTPSDSHSDVGAESAAGHSASTPQPIAAEKPIELTVGGQAVRNRIDKNRRHLASWCKREAVSCYRVYDADLPEYAAAIDVYGDHLYLQEYQAPSTIPEDIAERRFNELVDAVRDLYQLPDEHLHVRTRARQRGLDQYEKVGEERAFFVAEEGGLKFWVNLTDYLDTGLFLDHRTTRSMVRERVKGKHFLNLFSYTGSVSVYAAHGGAASTVSVDMSKTYTHWAYRNFVLNGFDRGPHEFVQADALEWLAHCRDKFDVIFIDPPTFSNSKRMDGVFDVQRDHVDILLVALELLNPGGEIIFSNNYRRFKLDTEALAGCQIEDWSKRTLPVDFARNPRIHQCWRITPP